MTVEKKKKDQVVLVGHRMCRGDVVLQQWLWRMSPFSALMVLPCIWLWIFQHLVPLCLLQILSTWLFRVCFGYFALGYFMLLWMISFLLFCDDCFGFCGFFILSDIFDLLMLPKGERNSRNGQTIKEEKGLILHNYCFFLRNPQCTKNY